jgi:hypothetical protein
MTWNLSAPFSSSNFIQVNFPEAVANISGFIIADRFIIDDRRVFLRCMKPSLSACSLVRTKSAPAELSDSGHQSRLPKRKKWHGTKTKVRLPVLKSAMQVPEIKINS